MRTTASFQQQSLGAILDTAIQLYRRHWWSLMAIVVLCYLPVVGMRNIWEQAHPFAEISSDFVRFLRAQMVNQLWWFLGTETLLTAAVVAQLAGAYQRERAPMGAPYRSAVRRVGVLIVASVLPWGVDLINNSVFLLAQELALVIWFSLPLFILYGGGVWFGAHFLFVPQVSVLEQRHPLRVLQRSWHLARHDMPRTVVLMVVTKAGGMLFTAAPFYAILSLRSGWITDHTRINAFLSTYYTVVPLLILPLQLAVYTVLYYDLRNSYEAYDSEQDIYPSLPDVHVSNTPS